MTATVAPALAGAHGAATVPASARRRAAGFTMIELMIVVAIIAILAAIAIPAYGRYVYRARRDDAKGAIMRIANAQERYYTVNNQYATLTDLASSSTVSFATSEKGYYKVSVALTNTNQNYKLTAKPQGAQASDDCGNLTYTDQGVKAMSGTTANGDCW